MEREKVLDNDEINRLADRAKQDDEKAKAVLIEYFYPRIYTYIFYKVNNKEDAEDLTQTVFLKMVKSLENQKGVFTAWLYKIASNLVIDFYRRRSFRNKVPFDEKPQKRFNNSSDDSLEKILMKEQFKKVLTKITDEQREVIILKFIQGYKNDEIARMIRKSIGAVKSLQFRALETLKDLLKGKV